MRKKKLFCHQRPLLAGNWGSFVHPRFFAIGRRMETVPLNGASSNPIQIFISTTLFNYNAIILYVS